MIKLSLTENNIVLVGVSLLSLITSVLVALINRENEHRLTSLEHASMSREERDKFLDVCFKMNMLWEFYEKTLPQLLKNPEGLDKLLDKATVSPASLTPDERDTIIKYLEDKAASDDITKKYMALLYLKILNINKGDKVC